MLSQLNANHSLYLKSHLVHFHTWPEYLSLIKHAWFNIYYFLMVPTCFWMHYTLLSWIICKHQDIHALEDL